MIGMSTCKWKLFIPAALLVLFAVASAGTVLAQEASTPDPGYWLSGTCGEFVITVPLLELEGCWDVKIDVPGQVFDGSAGDSGEWRSTFFYVEDALCQPDSYARFRVSMESIKPTVHGTIKLRQNNTVVERPFSVQQDCPQPLGWEWVLLAAAAFIIFFGYLLLWWTRKK